MIDISSINYSYNKRKMALRNVTKIFDQGKIYGIVGPNGAGKTTFLNLIAGVNIPRTGSISIDGYDIVKEREKSIQRVGLMPDGSFLDPDEKIIHQVAYFASFYNMKLDTARERAIVLMKKFGLNEELWNKPIKNLSLGQRRRVGLTMALIHNPDNILMDEPYNGFDPFGMKMVTDIVLEARNSGKTIIISSHILKEVQTIADEFVYLENGQLLRSVDTDTISKNIGKIWVKVLNPDDNLLKILQTFGTVRKINQSYEISTSSDMKVETSEINKELVKENYKVDSIYYEKRTVEDEFFSK
ncbi:MAG: ABC transporter ATP-binding protein [Cuniculiplasma sp.]